MSLTQENQESIDFSRSVVRNGLLIRVLILAVLGGAECAAMFTDVLTDTQKVGITIPILTTAALVGSSAFNYASSLRKYRQWERDGDNASAQTHTDALTMHSRTSAPSPLP